MKKLGLFFLILLTVGVLFLSYLGFVPVLSKYISKPENLNVSVDKNLVKIFEEKYGKPNGTGKIDLNVDLTSQEITSVFAVWEERDKNFPLKNVQVKFYPDGTGEASGYLKISTAVGLAKSLGYSDTDIEKGKSYIKFVNDELPFYVKGSGGMTNNVLSLDPTDFRIGKISVPMSITEPASKLVEDMIYRRLNQIGGVNIKEAGIRNGQFHLEGAVPETIKY